MEILSYSNRNQNVVGDYLTCFEILEPKQGTRKPSGENDLIRGTIQLCPIVLDCNSP